MARAELQPAGLAGLYKQFGARLSKAAIRFCIARAVDELRGSIAAEELDDMAVDLARERLSARADAIERLRLETSQLAPLPSEKPTDRSGSAALPNDDRLTE